MSEAKQITLYMSIDSPFPHRVRLALEEAKAEYDIIVVDLLNKPDWYEKKVNPDGAKVPFLVYGGHKLQPGDAPSADAIAIPESLVILEFLADAFPGAHLLPADPALRARARLFSTAADTTLVKAFTGFLFRGAPLPELLAALDDIQARLPPSGFAAGEWSIADAAVMPILVRLRLSLREGLGLRDPGELKEAFEAFESPRFARLQRYIEDNVARPSMVKSWEEDAVRQTFLKRLEMFRKQGPPAPR